jgi:hypothetical protein
MSLASPRLHSPTTAGRLSYASNIPFSLGHIDSLLHNGQRAVEDCQADAFRAREVQRVIKFANRSHPLSPRLQRDKSTAATTAADTAAAAAARSCIVSGYDAWVRRIYLASC